ncbi:hypothetical protein Tco_0714926 [Tanacetum coccineum]
MKASWMAGDASGTFGVVKNTILAHASSDAPFLSLRKRPGVAMIRVGVCDDDNLQQLCFVTHGLRTPVSWMGSRTSIAVAAMASVLRGPTVAGPSLEVHDLYVVRFRRKVHFEERKQANQKRRVKAMLSELVRYYPSRNSGACVERGGFNLPCVVGRNKWKSKLPSDIHMPPALMIKMKSRDVGVKNDILTPGGERKRRIHRISEIRKENSDNICEGKIMAIPQRQATDA